MHYKKDTYQAGDKRLPHSTLSTVIKASENSSPPEKFEIKNGRKKYKTELRHSTKYMMFVLNVCICSVWWSHQTPQVSDNTCPIALNNSFMSLFIRHNQVSSTSQLFPWQPQKKKKIEYKSEGKKSDSKTVLLKGFKEDCIFSRYESIRNINFTSISYNLLMKENVLTSTPCVFPLSTYKYCEQKRLPACVCVLPLYYPLPRYTKADKIRHLACSKGHLILPDTKIRTGAMGLRTDSAERRASHHITLSYQ